MINHETRYIERDGDHHPIYFYSVANAMAGLSKLICQQVPNLEPQTCRYVLETLSRNPDLRLTFPVHIKFEAPGAEVTVMLSLVETNNSIELVPDEEEVNETVTLYTLEAELNWPSSHFSLSRAASCVALYAEALTFANRCVALFPRPIGKVVPV